MSREAHPLRNEMLVALRNLRYPAGLRTSPLLDHPAVRSGLPNLSLHPSPDDLALALRTELETIIEELRPGGTENLTQRDWLRYYILHYLFRRGDSAQSVQHTLQISRSYFYELRNEAVDSVATLLAATTATASHRRHLVPHYLPLQPTPFVGREDEMARIDELLKNPACRLLTLVGSGGIGKTRLALQAADNRIETFQHGVYFVPLASLDSADLLVPTIADSLKFPFHGGVNLKEQLLSYLREKEMLVLLDNFEHLLSGDGIGLLVEILSSVPGVKLLVTSRERLNLQWEWLFEIHGLKFPQSGRAIALENYSAVQLFLQSASRVHLSFSLSEEEKPFVIRVCQSLEGVPLGIELAAAWVEMLSCREIAQEIERSLGFLATSQRDVPERHRSLRAAFEHSWNLLSEEERSALGKLSVFRSGFRQEAAERVTGASLSILTALVHKSLLRISPTERYEMLEVLRQYAEEKLKQSTREREEIHDRHCEYYAAFLHQREKHLKGKKLQQVVEEIGEEIDNVRAAWRWAIGHGKREEIGKSLQSFYRFYEMRSWFHEGEEALGKAVEALGGADSALGEPGTQGDALLWRILTRQGWFCLKLARLEEGRDRLEESRELMRASLSVLRRLDAWDEVALVLNHLGVVTAMLGEPDEAKRLFQGSIAVRREIGDQWGVVSGLNNLGNVAIMLGENTEAKQLLQESLAIRKEIGDRKGVADSLDNLGLIAEALKEYDEAKQLRQECIAVYREIGYRWGIANSLNNLGFVLCGLEERQEARKCFQESLDIAIDMQEINLVLEALVGMATLLAKEGENEQAVEFVAYTLHHLASSGKAKERAEQLLSELESLLSPQAFAMAQERGRAREFDYYARACGADRSGV